jgi:zinc transport system substrate-binding protein
MPRTPLVLLALCLAVAGCGSDGQASEPAGGDAALSVATAFYPLEFLAQRVGGDAATVENLTASGAEPHDLELTPRQVARLGEDDLVVYLEGFQPAVDEAVAQQAEDAALDVSAVTELQPGYVPIEEGVAEPDEEGPDPHVWLDPERYADLADAVAERMGELAPDEADAFTQRAEELRTELTALDEEYTTGLADCERTQIVTSHNAYGYLASAYDLEQVSITGLTPEGEPSPGRLAEVARYAEAEGVTTIFFEELVSPAVAESLAAEVGAEAVELSPLEGEPEDGDYFTQMRANLEVLQTALGCS